MPVLLKFILRRLLTVALTFLVVTATLYGIVMLTPPEVRAQLYIPRVSGNAPGLANARAYQNYIDTVIERNGLADPYPVQYVRWLARLFQGEWGYSPTMQEGVLEALVRRTPATVELTGFSLLVFIPLGLIAGTLAGARQGQSTDQVFRSLAFIGTSVPPFILGLAMIAVFYVAVRWFPPGRIGLALELVVKSQAFRSYTGLLTLDGLLNGRLDVTLQALRHLLMPALALSFAHWATLGRITRAGLLDELSKEYVISARARGIHERQVVWRHAFRNALAPALTSSALSAASLVTGVFIIESVFVFHGVSELITFGLRTVADASAAMGFAVYSVLLVLPVMFVLDLLRALLDPRVREGIVA